nr:putative ribonuclease h protein [Quercus suber]
MSEELNSSAAVSPGLLPKSAWRVLWNLKVPNRIKTLLWRAISDALPTRVNLVRRKVLSDPSCLACGVAQESSLHALWSCPKLLEVWSVQFNLLRREARDVSSFSDVFGLCLDGSHQCELFAMIAYQIWFRRNKLRLGEDVVDLKLINSLARDALLEFHHANTAPQKSLPACINDREAAGLGSIIRNDCGLVMVALTQVIPLPTSVEIVEVLAARRALFFAFDLGFDQVILEGDSETAIRALNSEAFSAAAFGHIISDVKTLSSHFRAVVFNHTRRMGNKVAHRLAWSACNFSSSFCTWIEEVPICFFADYSAEIINST